MEWDHIRKSWRQLVSKIVSPRSEAWDTDSEPNNSGQVAASVANAFSVEPQAPYTPEWNRNRSDASLHLSS